MFTLSNFRGWKSRASQAVSSFRENNEENFADAMFHNMLRHSEEFRAFIPSFITKLNSNVGLNAERGSQDALIGGSEVKRTEDLDPGMSIDVGSILERVEERPKLKPKVLLSRFEGLERKTSKRSEGKCRAEEQRLQDGCRGQKRTCGELDGADMGVESAKQAKMEDSLKTKSRYGKLRRHGDLVLAIRLTLPGSRQYAPLGEWDKVKGFR